MRFLVPTLVALTLAVPAPAAAQNQTETIDRTIKIGNNGDLKLRIGSISSPA